MEVPEPYGSETDHQFSQTANPPKPLPPIFHCPIFLDFSSSSSSATDYSLLRDSGKGLQS